MKIAVIGAGLMGRAAVYDLSRAEGVSQVGLFDIDKKLAVQVAKKYGNDKAKGAGLDAGNANAAFKALKGYDAAISCVTYKYNYGLTKAAINAGCHFMDLGGNNDMVRKQLSLNKEAKKKNVVVIPDCGLAPGMVSVLAADAIEKFDKVDSLKIRVGGLPQKPRPPLNYQMVFSAEGLINEYWEPCLILKDGKKKMVEPMSDIESLEFDGVGQLEAFYTSGGTSTLPETYGGEISFLDYKTIRYPGHCEKFRTMLEIGFASREPVTVNKQKIVPRDILKAVLDKNLSFGEPDLVLVRLTCEGSRAGSNLRVVYEIIDREDPKTGLTAMMRTTAFPATIIAHMAASGRIKERGCRPQELAVNPRFFIPELKKRNINLRISESPA
ncbi:MAG TPA: saccharopine dehydrogenase C-terminal domain-containing protein [candidate division Zixibacteria bacterium]|nr:saccharopine dehydrogenase C-terminal domain-containing protein [candidate division Zixibacteria bacterium]